MEFMTSIELIHFHKTITPVSRAKFHDYNVTNPYSGREIPKTPDFFTGLEELFVLVALGHFFAFPWGSFYLLSG